MSEHNVDVRILSLNRSSASYGLNFRNSDLVGVLSVSTDLAGNTAVALNMAENDNCAELGSFDTALEARTYYQEAVEFFTGNIELLDLICLHASPDHVHAFYDAVLGILKEGRQSREDSEAPRFRNLGSLMPKSRRLGS